MTLYYFEFDKKTHELKNISYDIQIKSPCSLREVRYAKECLTLRLKPKYVVCSLIKTVRVKNGYPRHRDFAPVTVIFKAQCPASTDQKQISSSPGFKHYEHNQK